MKQTIFMRFLFCKIHCPLVCFCKPSATHLCTSWPLKLEERPEMVRSMVHAVLDVSDKGNSRIVKEEHANGKFEDRSILRSCIRRLPDASKEASKKRVQWMDNFGKELAEIKEFESSETGEAGSEDESRCCLCVIL